MTVKDGLISEETKQRQHDTYLIRNHCLKSVRVVQHQPDDADDGSNICQQSLESPEDGVRNKAEEGPMFVYDNRAIMRFREGLVMVRCEDVGLVFVFPAC